MIETGYRAAVIGTETPAALLTRAGIQALGRAASVSYCIAERPTVLPALDVHRQVCGPQAAAYLHLVSQLPQPPRTFRSGIFVERRGFLLDWCLLAVQFGVCAPMRAVPHLSLLAQYVPTLRPFIAAVLTERGKVICRQQRGHDWLDSTGEIELLTTEELTSTEKGPWLWRHFGPWTADLTEAYVAAVVAYLTENPGRLGRIAKGRILRVSVWGPLAVVHPAMVALHGFHPTEPKYISWHIAAWAYALQKMVAIVAFRQAMRAAFEAEHGTR